MTPESIDPIRMSEALERARGTESHDAISDETLALAIEEGIESVPVAQRAAVLRAIGSDPSQGAVVAGLGAGLSSERDMRIFGFRREAWRAALAACAVLAAATGTWMMLVPTPEAPPVQVLDSTQGATDAHVPTFAEWFVGAPLRTTVGVLIVLCGALAVPSFWFGRSTMGSGRGPHPL
jgi:hypothetical protein